MMWRGCIPPEDYTRIMQKAIKKNPLKVHIIMKDDFS
jgi:hypothetical protein